MNTKLHAVTDAMGRPIKFFMSAGQVSDYAGAAALRSSLPEADWLLADRGYDADWYREALQDKGIKPCIPLPKALKMLPRLAGDAHGGRPRPNQIAHRLMCRIGDPDRRQLPRSMHLRQHDGVATVRLDPVAVFTGIKEGATTMQSCPNSTSWRCRP